MFIGITLLSFSFYYLNPITGFIPFCISVFFIFMGIICSTYLCSDMNIKIKINWEWWNKKIYLSGEDKTDQEAIDEAQKSYHDYIKQAV